MNKFDRYKETGIEWIGKIPTNWQLLTVGKFFNERKEKVDDVTYPPLSVTMSGIVDQLSEVAKTNDGDNRKLVKKDDFVINSRSDRKGSSGIANRDGSVSLINIVLKPKELNPNYIQYLFKSYYFKEEFFRNGKGIHWDLWTTRWDQFKKIYIPIPSNEEQKLISHYLDKKTKQIDKLIYKIKKKIELLIEQRNSYINQLTCNGINPNAETKNSNIEWIGQTNKNWKIFKLKYLFDEYFGGSWGEDPLNNQVRNLVNVIRVSEFDMGSLNVSDSIPTIRSLVIDKGSKKLIKKGDLILEKSGGGEKTPVGRVVIFNRNPSVPTINSNFTNLCRPNSKIVVTDYLVFLLFSMYSSGSTIRNIKQTTGIQNLDLDGFMSEKVSLPTINEQKEIVIKLKSYNSKILSIKKKYNDKIYFLKEYRKSLISSVVTGKKKVSEDML